MNTISHREAMLGYLSSPSKAAGFLNAAAEDGEVPYLIHAVRLVVDAQGGVGALAKKTGMSRTSLYKTLSENGNPEVRTLEAILAVYGIRLGFFTNAKTAK